MNLGIYVHLPFCPYLCPYCDFAKWPMRKSASSRYLLALDAEIASTPAALAQTIFFGGGTPNAYDASVIAALTARLRSRFPAPDGAVSDVSIEVNPELVKAGDMTTFAEAGIRRVSIGVQSFDADEITTLGRKHNPAQVRAAIESARAAGIASISIDLMFAVPGQTLASWRASLEAAMALGVDHISTYGLTIEEHTPYALWQGREPKVFFDDVREAEFYALAIETLETAGFEHYEISNFAKPGHYSRHNANYWANGEYIGLGVGAASYRGGVRSVHTRELEEYIEAVLLGSPIPGEAEQLAGLKQAGEAIMLSLRTARGVDLGAFRKRYGIDILEQYAAVIAEYSAAGLLERTERFLFLTKRGRFVANDVCGAFLSFE